MTICLNKIIQKNVKHTFQTVAKFKFVRKHAKWEVQFVHVENCRNAQYWKTCKKHEKKCIVDIYLTEVKDVFAFKLCNNHE